MKTFFLKMFYALALLLAAGGLVCAIALAIKVSAWIPLVAILALGGMAAPTAYAVFRKLGGLD